MSVGELDGLLGDLARIFAKVPMGFCVFDTELRYRYLNAALADRNGHTVEAHLGRRISDIYPKLAKAVEPALREAMDSGAAVVTGAMTGLIPRPGGGVAYFRNTFSPILDSQGHVIGVSCLVADVTELTAAEGKLQAHLGNLESQAAERSRELETAKSELEEEVRDRRRAEEAERDSRQHFTDAIESMSQGFVIYDADDRIIVANRRIKELLPELAVVLIPGTHFSDLVSTAIAYQGLALDEQETVAVIAELTAMHRDLTKPWDINTGDERRLRVIGTRTKSGGIFELTTDITKTQQAERAQRHSEQRFQDFANSSSDWLWEMDAELRFTYMSPNVERVVGVPAEWHYGKTRQELLGDEADSDVWRVHLQVLLRHEAFRDFTYFRQGEGIEGRWLSSSGIPIFDEEGVFLGYRGVGSDVTGRMEAVEALRVSETRFQDFAAASADWFAETDADHCYTYVSESVSVIGFTPDELIGRSRLELFGGDGGPGSKTEDQIAMQAHRPFRNVERLFHLAEEKWLRISGEPNFSHDNRFLGYRIAGTDITELKEKGEALRASEERFQDFANISADWFAETDVDDIFTFMSDSVSRLGFTPADFLGKARYDLLVAGNGPGAPSEEMRAIRAHEPFKNIDRKSHVATDSWIRVNGVPMFNDNGAYTGYRIAGTEISELMQKEEALRRSEQRFRDFADNASDWFWEMDKDLRFIWISSSVERIIGVPPEWHYGKTRSEIELANLAQPALQENLAALERHEPYSDLLLYRKTPLGYRWILSSGVPVFNEAGGFTGYFGTGKDITELKQKEEALRVSERRFREFADNASDWFFEMDENLRYTWLSDSIEKTMGVSAEWHYGKTISEINLSDMDTPDWQQRVKSMAEHKPFRDVLQRRVTEKGEFWILSSGIPAFDDEGRFKGYFGTGRDITALRQAEQTNMRFLDAIEKLSEGVALYDADDRLVICNAQYRLLSGVRESYLATGKTFEDLLRDNIAHGGIPIANDNVEGWLAERLARRRQPMGSFEMRRGDYELLISEDPLPDGGVVQTLRDVTQLKRSEQQLRQSQKMEAIGQLTGGVAHDFNNLLAVLMGNISLLEDELGAGHAHRELTVPMMRAVDQASELTKRMLAFARLQPLKVGLVDANALLIGMQPLLGRSLAEEITLDLQLADGLAPCVADQGQLEQAILNLAINARDAMPAGGSLIIKTEATVISDDRAGVGGAGMDLEPGPYVMITVMDHGEGITAEDQLRIFDPFFTTKEVGKGTGLGLSMVYGFVKQSNGHITVDSAIGVGSRFHVYLPMGEAEEIGDAPSKIDRDTGDRLGAVVLLVEDEVEVRTLLTRMLQRHGFHVLAGKDARTGLKMLAAHGKVDLLLTDVMLPGGMNGRQLADAALAENPALKVVFMSGYPKDAIVNQGRLDPDVRLLSKPFKPAALIDHIKEALDDRAAAPVKPDQR